MFNTPDFPYGPWPFFSALPRPARRLLPLVLLLGLNGCRGHHDSEPVSHHDSAPTSQAATQAAAAVPKPLSAVAQIGRKLFFDASLSVSGKMSCASCHNPDHGFGPPNDLSVQLGGPDLRQQGLRAVPSLRYEAYTPNFSIGPDAGDNDRPAPQDLHPHAGATSTPHNPARLAAQPSGKAKTAAAATLALVPQGGFFWDGRADTLQGQALGPLLNPMEMGNVTSEALLQKLQNSSYIGEFKALFGPRILEDRQLLMSEALFAIARYEAEETAFQPYDSKYDAYLRGQTELSEAEARGLKLFDDPKKGNCASCHLDKKTPDGRFPAFTDYQFEALGVPRNREIKANADPAFYDLSICGPERRDSYSKRPQNCGLFKTPSLRNVATRHAFFHNGVYHNLKDVLRFYAERDLHPEKFYPRKADGSIDVYNDLPLRYRANLDVTDAPFGRKPGEAPALNEAEMDDIIAFLGTLTDGYKPKAQAAGGE